MIRSSNHFKLLFLALFLTFCVHSRSNAQDRLGTAPYTLSPVSKRSMSLGGEGHESAKKIELEDIDGDGREDLWVRTREKTYFLINDGEGSFKRTDSINSSGFSDLSDEFYSYLQDLNGDGHQDLLVFEKIEGRKEKEKRRRRRPGKKELVHYVNDGEGHFQRKEVIDSSRVGSIICFHRSGQKGKDLLLLGKGKGAKTYIIHENGRTEKVESKVTDPHEEKRSKDIDGDGFNDLILLHDHGVSAFSNEGKGRFKELFNVSARDPKIFLKEVKGGQEIGVLGEGNKEGGPMGQGIKELYFRRVGPKGKTIRADTIRSDEPILAFAIEDLDDDRVPEVLTVTKKKLRVYSGQWEGDHELKQRVASTSRSFRISLKDLNGDGKKDLIRLPPRSMVKEKGDSYSLLIHLNGGDGTFQEKDTLLLKRGVGSDPHFLDLNGDGALDLIRGTARRRGDSPLEKRQMERFREFDMGLLAIHHWQKDEKAFQKTPSFLPLPISDGGYRSLIQSSDLNGDGAKDLLIAPHLYLHHPKKGDRKENGSPAFISPLEKAHGSKERMIIAGDPEGDPLEISLRKGPDSAKMEDIGNGIAFLSHPKTLKAPLDRTPYAIQAEEENGDRSVMHEFDLPSKISQEAYEWSFSTHGPIVSEPSFQDGKLFVGSADGALHAVDAKSGEGLWHFNTEHPVLSTPKVGEGTVYFTSAKVSREGMGKGGVHAVDASTGEKIWTFKTQGAITSSPELSNGKLYVGDHSGTFYALDTESGEPVWRFCTCLPIKSAPILAEGKVFFGAAGSVQKDQDGEECSPSACKKASNLSVEKKKKRRRRGFQITKLIALDAESGTKTWEKKDIKWELLPGSSYQNGMLFLRIGIKQPDGERLAMFLGLKAANGEERWRQKTDPREQMHHFGSPQDPSIDDGLFFYNPEPREVRSDLEEMGIEARDIEGTLTLAMEVRNGKIRWVRRLETDEREHLELHPRKEAFWTLPERFGHKGPGSGFDEKQQLKSYDRKSGELKWAFAFSKGEFPLTLLPYQEEKGRILIASSTVRSIPDRGRGELRGEGHLHALALEPDERSKKVIGHECQAPPSFKLFKGAEGGRRRGTPELPEKSFTDYFEECEPAILEYDHPWLTPKATHEIKGRTDDGGCRIQTRLSLPPDRSFAELPFQSISYTLDPNKSFAPQLKKAIKSCLSGTEQGFDCKRVKKEDR